MSQFEQSRPPSDFRRNLNSGAPRVGITESLNAPGTVFAPPYSKDAETINQALQALGLAANAVHVGINAGIQREAAIARQREMEEAEARRAEQYDRGVARQDISEHLPLILQDIQDGKIIIPDGQEIPEFFHAYLDARTEGQTDAFRREYREAGTPSLVRAMVDWQSKLKQDSIETLAEQAILPAIGSADSSEFAKAAIALQQLGIPEQEASLRVGLSAMQGAALQGNRQAFEAASQYLGGADPIQEAKLAITLEERVNQNRRATAQAAQDQVAGLLYERASGKNISYDEIRRKIDEQRSSVGDEEAFRLRSMIDREEQQEFAGVRSQIIKSEKEQIRTEAINQSAVNMLNARHGPAGLNAIANVEVTLSDGNKYAVKREEIRDEVITKAVEQIRGISQTPEEAISRTAEFLALNNATLPEWKNALETGANVGIFAFVSNDNSGAPVKIPVSTIAGYNLYKQLPEPLRASHMNEQSRMVYDMAMAAEDYIDTGEPEKAILRALSAQQSGKIPRIDIDEVRKAAPWTKSVANASEVQSRVRRTAQLLAATNGGDVPKALRSASKMVESRMIKIGPVMLPINPDTTANIPQNLPELSSRLSKSYLTSNPDLTNLNPSTLALLPIGGTGLFVMHETDGPAPTPVDDYRTRPGAVWDLEELLTLERVLAFAPDAPIKRYTPEEADRFIGKLQEMEYRRIGEPYKQLQNLRGLKLSEEEKRLRQLNETAELRLLNRRGAL